MSTVLHPSRYLAAYKAAKESGKTPYALRGNLLKFELLKPTERKTKSGIILPDSKRAEFEQLSSIGTEINKLVVVLEVGQGYYDARSKTYEPLETKVGDILSVPGFSCKYYSFIPFIENYEPNSIGIVREDDTHDNFGSLDDFYAYYNAINVALQGETHE